MSLEDHVPDLSLCKQWKDLGGRQDTMLIWAIESGSKWFVVGKEWGRDEPEDEQFAAPIEGELMKWIRPDVFYINQVWKVNKIHVHKMISDAKLANALLRMAMEVGK